MTNLMHIDLAPGECVSRLHHGKEQSISVDEGIVYVVLEEDEIALTAGDSLTIAAGERRSAWNAGDEVARIAVTARISLAPAA